MGKILERIVYDLNPWRDFDHVNPVREKDSNSIAWIDGEQAKDCITVSQALKHINRGAIYGITAGIIVNLSLGEPILKNMEWLAGVGAIAGPTIHFLRTSYYYGKGYF